MFDASVSVRLGDGTGVRFWCDRWLDGRSICDLAPHLFQAVGKRRRHSRTVADALFNRRWVRDIKGILSVDVISDYLRIWDALQGVSIQPGVQDVFVWKWTASGQYSASSAYRAFFLGRTALHGASQLWKTRAPGRCKFFGWLVLQRRCWTSDRLARFGLQNAGACAFCDQHEETVEHLLLQCPYSREVWFKLLRMGGLQRLMPQPDSSLADWWVSSRKLVPKTMRKGFDSVVLLIMWILWKERNARVFQQSSSSAGMVVQRIVDEGRSWIMAGFKQLSSCLGG